MNMVIFVYGLPGSGKSFFASKLAEKLNAAYINTDRIRKELFQERMYSEQEKKAVYDHMLALMKKNQKQDIVLDGTFHLEETRRIFIENLNRNSKKFFVEIIADEEVIKERLKKPRPYSEANYEVHQMIKNKFEPLHENHLTLKSTNTNIDEMISMALEYIHGDYET